VLNLLFLLVTSVYAAEIPFGDNILFAFEKCKTLNVDLNAGTLTEVQVDAFDLHCKTQDSDLMNYTCESFDPSSQKKIGLEQLKGGKDKNGIGNLRNAGGGYIRVSLEKNTAQYETPLMDELGRKYGRKMCVGIYLYEKDGLKKKAQ
jgi:hypothetical protein